MSGRLTVNLMAEQHRPQWRWDDEGGQTSVEWLGIAAVVVAVIAVLVSNAPSMGQQLTDRFSCMVSAVASSSDCGTGSGTDTVSTDSDGNPSTDSGDPAQTGTDPTNSDDSTSDPDEGSDADGSDATDSGNGGDTVSGDDTTPGDPDFVNPQEDTRPPDPTDPRLSPEEILEQYQVDPDPSGTTEYPGFPENIFIDPTTVTQTEADMLDDLSIGGKIDMRDIRNDAFGEASDRFPGESNDSHQDAFRHAYWNALMTRRYGPEWAEKYATAHEALPGNPADREAMDMYNNEVGRKIAIDNPDASPSELADLVQQAVENGDTVVIDADGDLARSDEVALGETGEANDPPRDDGNGVPIPGGDPAADGDYDS